MNFKKNTPKLGEDEAQVGTIPRHKYIFSLRRLAVFLGVAILVPAVFGTAHVFLGQPEVSETEEQLEVSPYIEVDGQLLEFPEHLRYMGNHQEQQVDPEVLQEALEDHKATKNEQDEYGYYVFLAQIYSRMDDKNKQLEAYKGALAVVERQPIISHEQEQIHQGLLREIAELEVELNE
ncbi:MAG: hypothetical protein U5K77_01290 [Candidatus Saccharibacteria bacterium]|nr:hypothetical protein [Candidatus Saccharibacteria bacterium]